MRQECRDIAIEVLIRLRSHLVTFGSLVVAASLGSSSIAQELRTYEFVIDSDFNYTEGCGACPLVYGTRARVTGSLEVLLDFASSTGAIRSLDVTLVDVETLIGAPASWVPQPDRPLFGDSPLFDRYIPPLTGVLESSDTELLLYPHGISITGDDLYPIPELFRLSMSGESAELNFTIPLIDQVPRIIRAPAILANVSPEPSAFAISITALALATFSCSRSRRRAA